MRIAALALVLLSLAVPTAHAEAPATEGQKAILVTGASTGIGRKITDRLAADGYFVYAGARKDADIAALNAIKNVQALRLDVTKPDEIAAAVATVTQGGRGLWGLVNNAGVAVAGPFADLKEEDFDFVMNVNAYGPFRMTKAFLPLIAASKGRIVTISSISGILSSGNLGVYSMSKHAVEAFGDSLAAQVEPLGVAVSLIEPGNYNSQIGVSAAARTGGDPKLADRSRYKEPDDVALAVEQALFEPVPKRRYMVVPDQHEAEITIRKAIQELVQLNEGQDHTYGREALIGMLDEALKTARPATTAAPTTAAPTTAAVKTD
ncbi:MAG TPA: SDR family NAD(P)-dependent oxidoreductase [Steroidobacteraceae bacterium]|jgi:NAD(P)-dependent dehydrogenase (short-subunit alcohol dehydrogenase family)